MCEQCSADLALGPGLARSDLNVECRAIGTVADAPAWYQVRQSGAPWPQTWVSAKDLCKTLGALGLSSPFSASDRKRYKRLHRLVYGLKVGHVDEMPHEIVAGIGFGNPSVNKILNWLYQAIRFAHGMRQDLELAHRPHNYADRPAL